MGRPKKSAPAPIEPEEESQELPEEEPEAEEEESDEPEAAGGKAISKAAAVRDALAQGEGSPDDGVKYIKKVHGIDITNQMFSSYKAQEKARLVKKAASFKPEPAKRGPKPKAASPAPAAPQAAKAPPAVSNGEADLIESLETLKPLIASMGAEKVKRLVDLLG